MSRFIAAFIFGLVVTSGLGLAEAARPSDTLFPASTKAFASIPNVDQLSDHFNRSPVGRLLEDPIMQPFREDLHRQLHEKGGELKDAVGISIKDVEHLATGEVGLAVIKNQQGKATLAAILDVTGNLPAALQLLERVDAHLLQNRAAKRSDQTHHGVSMRVYNVPPSKPEKTATQGVYFFIDNLLGITDDASVAQEIIEVATGQRKDNLAGIPSYQACMQRAEAALKLAPHIAFWIEPIGLAEAIRVANPQPSKKGADALKIAKSEGFDAIQGLGGHLNFSVENYGILYRVTIHAPGPYHRAMRMVSLPNGGDFRPPSWCSRQIAGYSSFNLDALNAFDNFGTLFDALFGEGEDSVWADALDSLKNDKNGPRVDLRNDVIAHLNNHGSVLTDNDHSKPVGPHTQRRLFAIETKNPPALAAAIDRLMRNDKSVKVHVVEGIKIYEVIPEVEEDLPELSINDVQAAKKKQEPPPHGGVAVAHGQLLISSHWEFVRQVVNAPQAADPLFSHRDYLQAQAALAELLPNVANSVQGFGDDNESFVATWEMFRQGRLSESSVPLAKLLNALLNDPDEGKKWKQLDGTKLPPFDEKVKKYGSFGGGGMTSEANGWFQFGFSIDNSAPHVKEANGGSGTKR